MTDYSGGTEIAGALTVQKIVWIAMLLSLGIYLFIGSYLAESEMSGVPEILQYDKVRVLLYGASVMTIGSIKYIRNSILFRRAVRDRDMSVTGLPQNTVIARYMTALVISLAMAESVGIYGMVLAILGNSTFDLYILVLVSALAMYYYRPKAEEMADLLRTSGQKNREL